MSELSVLAATTVTNTGKTVVHGEVGVHPGSAITGFPPGIAGGATFHHGDSPARQAMEEASAIFDDFRTRPQTKDLTGKDLGGMFLSQGIYGFRSSAGLTGVLTLQGDGDFIFVVGSTLTTAEKSRVVHLGKGKVIWLIGSSATLGTGTEFVGDIIALASVTLVTGSKVRGRLAALEGAVTLDSAQVG